MIVAGPNGSGKTTAATQFATSIQVPYIGADEIAKAISPAAPEAVQIKAGREFIRTVEDSIANHRSCVIESTLSGLSFQRTIRKASVRGFQITIVFVFVNSADVCVARVAERVRKGGHDVPAQDIRRRFHRSITNFWRIYRRLADNWVVLYNGGSRVQDVLVGSRDNMIVRDESLHVAFLDLVKSSDD